MAGGRKADVVFVLPIPSAAACLSKQELKKIKEEEEATG
jgi:hypothetical protein